MQFTIGKYVFNIKRRSRLPWKFQYHKFVDSTARAISFCKVWLDWEDWTAEVYPVCAMCDSPEIGERGYGDEGWTVCDDCGAIEQGYRYVNLREYEHG